MTHFSQPTIISEGPRFRPFAASAVAVQAIIVNPAQEVLLLSNPRRNLGWQVVSGALEAGETVLDGTLREIHEELGPDRPLGVVHVETFHYDARVRYMLGTYFLFDYQGGKILPGDDMAGSTFRWWDLSELESQGINFHPSTKLWVLKRAAALYPLWKEDPDQPLQEALAVAD